ncbi:Alpha/Beta hydrolase protein [Crucibulum laeve]|uniref:Alpha/Beta hydrolase protein n=1 Tax=Crucibulum laeve TaxID=68775 RepID=A0A5C3MDG1_9AGAR|nr:Alpha/Beta hydrolase protein [Crucibulum laeve]
MEEIRDIPYVQSPHREPLREFDLYLPSLSGSQHQHVPPLICFVHGGAWRSEDKKDHSDLARKLVSFTNYAVAVPNYRLSQGPENAIRHPAHAEDILSFLNFLMTWIGPSSHPPVYDSRSLILMGHSCSAHMLSSVFLDSSSKFPSLQPTLTLLRAVKAIIMSEGIYDIDLLLSRFPDYRDWFIEGAFGKWDSYATFAAIYPLRNSDIHWLIIHSKGDTLVDLSQSMAIYNHLRQQYAAKSDTHVSSNTDSLEEDHNDILNGDEFVKIVGDFVLHLDVET